MSAIARRLLSQAFLPRISSKWINYPVWFESKTLLVPQLSRKSFYTSSNAAIEPNEDTSTSSTSVETSVTSESSATTRQGNVSQSVDDFKPPNIFTNGIPFFSPTGMTLFRVIPAMFKKNANGNYVADNGGSLFVTFYPQSKEELHKFDTTKGHRIKIRAVDIGSVIEINPRQIVKDITIQGYGGHLQILPGDTEETLKLKGIPRKRFEDKPEFIEVEIPTGQFKTLQTLLTHAAPTLFGWQVLLDPRLLDKFMDPSTIQEEEMEKSRRQKESFFEF